MNSILTTLANAGLILFSHIKQDVNFRGSLTNSDSQLTLGLQKCSGSDTWTLHGVWPEKENCGGPAFDESQVQDLLSDMKQYWLSCPEYPSSDDEFWTHEWSKHGSCSGLSQHEYFSDGLALRSKYADLCDGQSGNSCDLTCDGYTGPCTN
eukprot:g3872.t1